MMLDVVFHCFRTILTHFGAFIKIKKMIFVDPSHTFGLCTCDAWCGFLSFSDNTHTLWCFMNILHLIVCQTRSILWDVLRWSRAGTWRLSFFYYAFAVLLCIALSGILGQYAHWAIEVYIYVSWLTRVSFFVIMSDNSCCFCWNGFIVYTYILLQTLANALTGAVVFWILACHACLYVEYVTCKVRFLETFGNVYIG